jgi:hypothetical protein
MTTVKTIGVLLLASTLFGCVATTGGAKKPADPFEVNNAKAFKGKQEVVIGSFKVSFITFDKSSSKATSSMASSDPSYAKMTLRAKLDGVTDATFQQITNDAYADFLTQLQASGYTLGERSRIESTPSYSKLPATTNPHKVTSSFKSVTGGSRESATFAPTGLPLYHKGNDYEPAAPFEMASVAGESGIPTLNVHYIVHFALFQGKTSRSSSSKSASMTMGQMVRMEHGSQLGFVAGGGSTFSNPNGNVKLTWGETSEMTFGETSDATSGAQEAANTFSSVVGLFSGSSASAREYLMMADPVKYSAAAKDVIHRTSGQFVQKLASLR